MTPTEILHNAHREHPLALRDTSRSFRCDGCGTLGVGPRRRCDACDFDLHEFCSTCPPAARFAFHGQHPLTFQLAALAGDPRTCDLCGAPVRGMRYGCRPCGLDVHPVCSQLSATAASPMHPAHALVLAVAAPVECTLCGGACLGRYQCVPCNINLHPRCLLGADPPPPAPRIPNDIDALNNCISRVVRLSLI